jgi:mRNA interferase HigB
MHIISRKPFRDAAEQYPNSRIAIEDCYRVLKHGTFSTPDELRQVFPSLDNFKYRDRWWVIDISGNRLRLMAFIEFKHNRLYVRHIVTHAEYDKLTAKYRAEKEGKR